MVWGIEWENAKEEQRTEQWKRFGQWGQNADSSSLVQTEWQTKRHRAERGESFTEEKMKMKGLSIFLLFCSIKAIPLKTGHHHKAETFKVGKSAFYRVLVESTFYQNLSRSTFYIVLCTYSVYCWKTLWRPDFFWKWHLSVTNLKYDWFDYTNT